MTARRQDGSGPELVDGVFYAGPRPTTMRRGWLTRTARAWVGGVRRVASAARVAVRSLGVEVRSITALPWDSGGPAHPGMPSLDRALALVPVFAAGRLLAGAVSTLPLAAYRRVGEQRVKLGSLPALFRRPSVQGTLLDWLYRAVTSLVYHGNAIGLIVARDSFGRPLMVEWLDPGDVTVLDTMPAGPGSYVDPVWYWRGRVVPAEDLVHIPWFVLPGRVLGLSPLAAYASVVNAGLAAQDYSREWFENGGVPPGTFKNTQKIVQKAEADEVKARLVAAIRSRKPIVYGADWDYHPITLPANEARFVEMAKLGATQIAAIYGVPAERIGGELGGSRTYTNAEFEQISFVQDTLLEWVRRLEAVFDQFLPPDVYVRFNLDARIRVDTKTRHDIYRIDRDIGLRSIDELRALEDLPPLPDRQGDEHTPLPILTKTAGPPTVAPTEPRGGPVVLPFLPRRRTG